MSNIKRLTEFENAMEVICDECQVHHDVKPNYCENDCMVRQVWRDILAEQKKEREVKPMELTNVIELIEKLEKFPPDTKVYVGGCQGYIHITADDNGKAVVNFDDSEEI